MPINDVGGTAPLPQAGGADAASPAGQPAASSSSGSTSSSGGDGFWSQLGHAVVEGLRTNAANEALQQAVSNSDSPKSSEEKKKQNAEAASDDAKRMKQTVERENKQRAAENQGRQFQQLTQEGSVQSHEQHTGESPHAEASGAPSEATPEGARLAGSQGGLSSFAGGPAPSRGGNLGLFFNSLPGQQVVSGNGAAPGETPTLPEGKTAQSPTKNGGKLAGAKEKGKSGGKEASAAGDAPAGAGGATGKVGKTEEIVEQGKTETPAEIAKEASHDGNVGKQVAQSTSRENKKSAEKKQEAGQGAQSPKTAPTKEEGREAAQAHLAETDGNIQARKQREGDERIEGAERVSSENGSHGHAQVDEAMEGAPEFVGDAAEKTERTLDPIAARRIRRETQDYGSSAQDILDQAGLPDTEEKERRRSQELVTKTKRTVRARDLSPEGITKIGDALDGVELSPEARKVLQDLNACNTQLGQARGPAPTVATALPASEAAAAAGPAAFVEGERAGMPSGYSTRKNASGSVVAAMANDVSSLKEQMATLVTVVSGLANGQAKAEDETKQGIHEVKGMITQANPRVRFKTDFDRFRDLSGPQFSRTEARMEPMRVAVADQAASFNQGIMSGQAYKRQSTSTPINPQAAVANQTINPTKQNKLPGRRGLRDDDPKAC